MRNCVIYFPYIQVPDSPWLTQMLLYWDKVSSIVPSEFVGRPESLGAFMEALVREELVWQVEPRQYIDDMPRFAESFANYIVGLGSDLSNRRNNLTEGVVSRVHIEKLGRIGDQLCDLGLARSEGYPWYEVDRDTAEEFMGYLATTLGQLPRIDSVPLTDSEDRLRHLISAGVRAPDIGTQLQTLRLQMLEEILPVPSHTLEASEIRAFKDRHGTTLGEFRRLVEREIVDLANISDEQLRERRKSIFFEEAQERIEEIQGWMSGRGWRSVLRKLAGIVAAIPGVPPIFGLARAVQEAVTGGEEALPSRAFAYAAFAQALRH